MYVCRYACIHVCICVLYINFTYKIILTRIVMTLSWNLPLATCARNHLYSTIVNSQVEYMNNFEKNKESQRSTYVSMYIN